jgi:hypothetical protein
MAPIAAVLPPAPRSTTSQFPTGVSSFAAPGVCRRIVDDEIQPAVVVEIADGGSTAHAIGGERRSVAGGHFLERPIAEVVVQERALPVARGRAEPRVVQLWVDVPVDRRR